MLIEFNHDLVAMGECLAPFLELAGAIRWRKRAVQLGEEAISSPFKAKIVDDYHWLELALSAQMIAYDAIGRLEAEQQDIESIRALYFAQTTVECTDACHHMAGMYWKAVFAMR